METLIIFFCIISLSIGCIVNYLKTETRLSKIERDIEDSKHPTVKGSDLAKSFKNMSQRGSYE